MEWVLKPFSKGTGRMEAVLLKPLQGDKSILKRVFLLKIYLFIYLKSRLRDGKGQREMSFASLVEFTVKARPQLRVRISIQVPHVGSRWPHTEIMLAASQNPSVGKQLGSWVAETWSVTKREGIPSGFLTHYTWPTSSKKQADPDSPFVKQKEL